MKQILLKIKTYSGYRFQFLLLPVLFSMFANFATAQTSIIYESYAILSINGNLNYYNMQSNQPIFPYLEDADLGVFTKGTNTLVVNGGQNGTTSSGSCDVTSSVLLYRVYPTGSPSGSLISIDEPLISSGVNETWEGTSGSTDLIASLPPGTYTLEVHSESVFTGCGDGTLYSDNAGANYNAVFEVVNPQSTWNGSTWSNGTPTSSIEAIIDGAYTTTTNGVFNTNKLTVNSGASITINSGTNLTVQNEVINNGSLVVENDANLIQVNNTPNTGSITVNRNSSLLKRLDYTLWSSPVSGTQTLAAFSPLTLQSPSRFYTYDSGFGAAGAYSAIAVPTTATFDAGAGYLIRMPNNADAVTPTAYAGQFTGVLNNGNIPVTLSYIDAAHSYNLVGNPYASVIDADTFINTNTTNIETTLYFWRKINSAGGSAYATYIPVVGGTATSSSEIPNGKIQVGQGFFVKAKSPGGLITNFFTNTMRDSAPVSTQFFKTKQLQRDRIWLNLTNTTGVFSQALIAYITDGTVGVDIYDGKYINDSQIAFTSNINNEEYTIQSRPVFDVSDVVALNFKTDLAGDYTIAIGLSDGLFANGQDVYLFDSKTGAETNLKTSSYAFTATSGVDNTRFSLKYQKTLKVDAPIFNENSVTVYKNNGVVYVNSREKNISNIKVYDVQGRLIAEQKNVKSSTASIHNLKAMNQVLIVKVTSDDNKTVSKKVAN